jgi:hypothetical protein
MRTGAYKYATNDFASNPDSVLWRRHGAMEQRLQLPAQFMRMPKHASACSGSSACSGAGLL